ncbi:MAG: TonB-dependent receptor plug domain-containing protein [Porticoccaceae bacterium]
MSSPFPMQKTLALAIAIASIPLAAQEAPEQGQTLAAEEIVVIGTIPYRNRSAATEPTLEYDSEYFQRFEPLTAGDALRRVPSVTFLSDVLESDGPRMRGLAPGYSQILINGERVPGGENDRSFFMDRIPAELIDRVEIKRSASARRTGDAMAGALNMILRDGYALDGGYVRLGTLRYDDGEFKPSLGAVYGGEAGEGRFLLGMNYQGRYNPKIKFSERYGDGPENDPNYATNEFDNREDQTDTRDGTDYSFNGRYEVELGNGAQWDIGGFVTYTDREEAERSREYDDPTAISGPVFNGGNLLTDNQQLQEIEQTSYTLDSGYEVDMMGGRFDINVGFATYEEDRISNEDEIDFEDMEVGQEIELTDIQDDELTIKLDQTWDIGSGLAFETGIYWLDKQRDTEILEGENEIVFTLPDWDQFSESVFTLRSATPAASPADAGVNSIEENRLDLYGVFNGESGPLSWEAGLRYETTESTITDATVSITDDKDYEFLLPSASLKYELTGVDRITASVARTVRRPSFNILNPALLEEEMGDDDFIGNPDVEPESAWGIDIGYERRIATTGVVGLNFFYRDVTNLIEEVTTGDEGSGGPGTVVFRPENVGDGEVYGLELDLSTPLTAVGMPDTGVFANYSWLDSKVDDFIGERMFNDQSDFVFNVGFIHNLPAMEAAFGATYGKQGDAYGRVLTEEVITSYGGNLEIFVEKSFGSDLTIRLVGQNLLDSSKDETFNKFDSLADQIARNYDEYELETESSGPVYQLMARYAF